MQSNDKPKRTADALNHPTQNDWMELLYEEVSAPRKQELHAHLQECPQCAALVREWRSGMSALDLSPAPVPAAPVRGIAIRWQPMFRWATAAAAVLIAGFILGRTTSDTDRQLRELQASVSRLTQLVDEHPAGGSGQVAQVATRVAGEETLRLLTEYSRNLELQRAEDRQTTALAVRSLENRISGLRDDLETVAVNTHESLHETHQNLAQFADFTRRSTPDGAAQSRN
jgi:hypothetical protein